jgi:hypothetical protein
MASPASPNARSPRSYMALPLETARANSVGLQNVLELARAHGGRALFASTSEIYGDPHQHPQREDYWGNVSSTGPRSCYDEAKRFGEALLMIYVREGAVAEPNLSHPHNWVLHMWLEMGLLGLIAFLWLIVTFLRRAIQQRGWVVAGALGAMADILVHGLIDNSYFLVDLAFLFWLILAVVDQQAAKIETT